MPQAQLPGHGKSRTHITLSDDHLRLLTQLGDVNPHVTRARWIKLALDFGLAGLLAQLQVAPYVEPTFEVEEPPPSEPAITTEVITAANRRLAQRSPKPEPPPAAEPELPSPAADPIEEQQYYAAVRKGLLADDDPEQDFGGPCEPRNIEDAPPGNEGSGPAGFSSSVSPLCGPADLLPVGSEGALEGNDEAASACAGSPPSEPADPNVTPMSDTEPAPPPTAENIEPWMAELFDGV